MTAKTAKGTGEARQPTAQIVNDALAALPELDRVEQVAEETWASVQETAEGRLASGIAAIAKAQAQLDGAEHAYATVRQETDDMLAEGRARYDKQMAALDQIREAASAIQKLSGGN